jgi:hypothetical protein
MRPLLPFVQEMRTDRRIFNWKDYPVETAFRHPTTLGLAAARING